MGTNVFFSENPQTPETDMNFQDVPSKLYDYFAQTNKVLKMKRIFVEDQKENTNCDGEIENLEHLRVTKTYEEALNQFLKPGELQPRKIDNVLSTNNTCEEKSKELNEGETIMTLEDNEVDENCLDDVQNDPDYLPT